MLCYECSLEGVVREAIGFCRHCSAGLCAEHAHIESDTVRVMRRYQTFGTIQEKVELPLKARKLLCSLCRQALHQPGAGEAG